MKFTIRPARRTDIDLIAPWTTGTFKWGDYVADRLPAWLGNAGSEVLVCVTEDDTPVALCHAVMLSPTEGWLEAARVHPDHKRSGMGSALNDAGVAWVRQQGAKVVRLAIEEDNVAARRQVESLDYRATSNWVFGQFFDVERTTRAPEERKLRAAHATDVDPAWVTWSSGDLSRAARGLYAFGWQWRRLRPADLEAGANRGHLFQSPGGWIMADVQTETEDSYLRGLWLNTTPEEAPGLIDAFLDLVVEKRARGADVKTPSEPWMVEALHRAGAKTKEIMLYSRAL